MIIATIKITYQTGYESSETRLVSKIFSEYSNFQEIKKWVCAEKGSDNFDISLVYFSEESEVGG